MHDVEAKLGEASSVRRSGKRGRPRLDPSAGPDDRPQVIHVRVSRELATDIERALVAFRAVKGRGATVSDLVRECLSEAVARRLDQGVADAVLERSLGRKTHGLDVAGVCARD